MTEEDEEFNRIEREATMRKESVKATVRKESVRAAMTTTQNVMAINGSRSFEEAQAELCKIHHPEKHGLFGIATKDNMQLWCVMPQKVLDLIVGLDDEKNT